MRPRTLSLLALFLFTGLSCEAWLRDRYRAAFFAKLARLQSYTGLVREDYGSSAWTESKVRYRAPDRFYSEIVGAREKSWTGLQTARNGATFVLYHPRAKFGTEYRNLPLTPARETARLSLLYDRELAEQKITQAQNEVVAGLTAVRFEYTPVRPGPFVTGATRWLYEEFSFPLRQVLRSPAGPVYGVGFTSIEFNHDLSENEFRLNVAPDADMVRFDFAGPPLSPDRARTLANFPVRLPAFGADAPGGAAGGAAPGLANFKLERICSATGLVPALAYFYTREPFFVLIAMVKDYGITPLPMERGLRFERDGRTLYLSFLGTYPLVYFQHSGVHYTLVGSVASDDLLEAAASIR